MFLSYLVLNPRSREVFRDISDCGSLHRRVMSGFGDHPGADARAALKVLHRLEISSDTGRVSLYVQSSVAPDWSRLPADYLTRPAAFKPISENYAAIREGAVLVFRLLANPTRKIDTRSGPDGERRNGRRVGFYREEDQRAWFQRKAAEAGFRTIDLRVLPKQPACAVSRQDSADRRVFVGILFEGWLVVEHEGRFRAALTHGLGPGKAYGFGLLSVAPA